MGVLTVDSSEWPLVRIRLDGEQSDDDVERLLRDFGDLLQRGEPYLALAEIRGYRTEFAHVRRVAHWTLRHAGDVTRSVAAAALVIPSERFRFMLSTFFLVTPIPCPFLATTDLDEGTEWLWAQARELNIPLTI